MLTTFVTQRLRQLLEEKRVVVWYDAEGAFAPFVAGFDAPSCAVVHGQGSRLAARKRAEEVFRELNDADRPAGKRQCLLVYLPWGRGKTEAELLVDPFEGFARAGATFGDSEAEQLRSLARQVYPERTGEVDRLFAEGNPTLGLLDGLARTGRSPLLRKALGTESVEEAVARLLCVAEDRRRVREEAGALDELLRLAAAELAFEPPPRVRAVDAVAEALGRHVLFSEFALDLPVALPGPLAELPRCEVRQRETVFRLCDRMRGTDETREGYIALARKVEDELRLPAATKELPTLGVRDTFPFEERVYLARLEALAGDGNLEAAREIVARRRLSVWRQLPERALLWKLAERALDLLDAATRHEASLASLGKGAGPREIVAAYLGGGSDLDRHQRLVEQGAASVDSEETQGLLSLARRRHRQVTEAWQERFLAAVAGEGWPPEGLLRQTETFDRFVAPSLAEGRKTAFFLVDAMRYEMGPDLGRALEERGTLAVHAAGTVLPTTTPCGMAALMPGADGALALVRTGTGLVPAVAGRRLPGSAERMALLAERYGDRFVDLTLGDVMSSSAAQLKQRVGLADFVAVRTQEIDSLGEGHSGYLARKLMTEVLADLAKATDRLAGLGIGRFVFAADHGHVFLPEVAPGEVVTTPEGEWGLEKRRCRVGASRTSAPGTVSIPCNRVGIAGDAAEIVVPVGFKVFIAGQGYFHEGISLQECLVPVVTLEARGRAAAGDGGEEVRVTYRSDRFTSRIVGLKVWFNALFGESVTLRIEAFDGSGPKAKLVGEAADCDARDPATGVVTLRRGHETQVPLRVSEDFTGASIEVRASDAAGSGHVFARLKLKNGVME